MNFIASAYTNQTATLVLDTTNSFISDEHYFDSTQVYLDLVENNYRQISPDLTCSKITTTSYSIASFNGALVPSWIELDAGFGTLKIKAPVVNATTDYSFYIMSTIQGKTDSVPKLIAIRVNKWSVANCQKCSSNNFNWWDTCNSGFNLNSWSWIQPDLNNQYAKTVESANIGTKSAVGLTSAIILISNL